MTNNNATEPGFCATYGVPGLEINSTHESNHTAAHKSADSSPVDSVSHSEPTTDDDELEIPDFGWRPRTRKLLLVKRRA
ncbi:hypothetical protein H0H92_010822 [Tricholoma furcatifolium]|nr:hypothetical protein H0H92_010822 [Tricholoma furcatifolium]